MALAPFRVHAEDQREKPVKSSLIPVLPLEQRGLSQRIASRASPRYCARVQVLVPGKKYRVTERVSFVGDLA